MTGADDSSRVPQLSRLVVGVIRFLRLVIARFIDDRGMSNAASLSYTTLLSLVPLMTIVLAVFAAFPVSQQIGQQLQDFVFDNFVPASGEVVQQHLQQFIGNATKMTGTGLILLILVALMMMATIDRTINTIWRVKGKRGTLSKFIMYWAILSLGPLLIGLSVAATSYLVSMPLFADSEATKSLRAYLLEAMPVASSVVAFTLIYAVVPNRPVLLRHALSGALVAALLFEFAKRAFVIYLTHFPAWQAIYGALAVIPMFFVWIYLSWVITLLGAEFSYCLGAFRNVGSDRLPARGHRLLLAYRLLHQLWLGQQQGLGLSVLQLRQALDWPAEEQLEQLLSELHVLHLVMHTEEGDWVLARDLSRVTLKDLYASSDYVLPSPGLSEDPMDAPQRALDGVLRELDGKLNDAMSVSLEDLYRR